MDSKLDFIEIALLGSVLNNPEKLTEIDCLPEHFESSTYAEIFKIILNMSGNNQPIDLFTVSDALERHTGKDWMTTLAKVAQHSVTAENSLAYSSTVKQKYIERQSIAIANNMISGIGSLGQSCIDDAIVKLMALGNEAKSTALTIKEALKQSIEHLQRVHDGETEIALSTGYDCLDQNIGGLHDSDLIVIGARPAMGKTALLLNLMLNASVASGFISTEQSAMQIAMRMMSIKGGIKSTILRSGNFNDDAWSAINSSVGFLSQANIHIDEASRPSIIDVQRQARRWKQQYGIKALWVDYIQRIDGPDKRAPKVERIEEVVKGLKGLAKELDIPVVALSQVNRSVDTRTDSKRPGMGDLSDSSSIEKEADQIIMLYRDEVYNDKTESPGIAELIVEKNRHGPTNFVRLGWQGENFRFKELAHGYY